MLSIRQWLGSIGLERYAGAFEANAVDLDILPSLTEEDLERLGVLLGDRRRISKVLEEYGNVAGPHPASASSAVSVETMTADGERRQVTVLYCDLVGSTHLSHILDPEAYRTVMSRYHERAIAAVQRFDGFVQQIQGDGIVAYFGYPIAHEQDADRAIRAALQIMDGLGRLDAVIGHRLQVRVGIASGMVVVSHILAPDKSAVGSTPNLAQRLQAVANAGETVISDRTRALAGGGFEYEDLGLHQLKGIGAPVSLWRVIGPSAMTSRFDAATQGRLTPMVGREQEVDQLLERWKLARAGHGQVVLVRGEPGIGKSRMLRCLRDRVGDEIEMPLQYQCSPYYQNSAFYPIVDHLQHMLGFAREQDLDEKLDQLERRLIVELRQTRAECHLLALMLSIECTSRYGKLQVTPQRQKEDTIQALVNLMATIAQQPAAVLFEDVHWADPTTLQVLDALVARAATLPLLVIITFRPEFKHDWTARPHISHLVLKRLSRDQSATLVMQIPAGKPLPLDLVTEIVEKTDGVPLFLEELTKAVLESNLATSASDHHENAGSVRKADIPATLRDSLMARLDKLFPVKELAQTGAVIGREFSHELMAMICPLAEPQLTEGMDKLVASELIFRRGVAPAATYLFKHALVKDAAYGSLLKSKRSQLHAQIANVLEQKFPGIAAVQPEVLAHHFEAASLHDRAVHYWKQAGQQALDRVALAEAVAHLTSALAENELLPTSAERDLRELEIRMLLGAAYLSWKGHAAPEVLQAMGPARNIAVSHRLDAKLVPILFYIWMHHTARLELGSGLEIAEQLDVLSKSSGDSYAYVVARNVENMTHGWMGNFIRAREAAERGVRAYDPQRHAPFVHVYNHDQKCGILSWAVHFLWMLGYPDQAQQAARELIDLARSISHPYNLAFSLTTGCAALVFRGETSKAHEWIAEAGAVGRDSAIGYVTHFFVPFWTGLAQVTEGKSEQGYANITMAWEYFDDGRGLLLLAPFAKIMRATAAIDMGRLEEATRLLDDALAVIDKTGHRMHEAEAYRVLGILRQRRGDLGASAKAYEKAIEVARTQKAKGFELRAATDLARLWQRQDRCDAARDLLAPIFNWFTEGLDTRDLVEARGVLEELDGKAGKSPEGL